MNNQIIYIIIIVLIVILLITLLIIKKDKKLEHLSFESDEAIQNLASLYNKNELTIGKLNVTADANVNTANLNTANLKTATLDKATIKSADTIKTDKILLGNKYIMSGVGDWAGNDIWLRLMRGDGQGYGSFAAQSLWTADNTINGRNIFAELDSLQAQINQRVVIGGRYGFHRGHDGSIIWDHGIILNACSGNNCRG